jgi:hypothetical protein
MAETSGVGVLRCCGLDWRQRTETLAALGMAMLLFLSNLHLFCFVSLPFLLFVADLRDHGCAAVKMR